MHLRALERSLAMPLGTLEYHLRQMERDGLLVTRDEGRFKAYFTQEALDRRDRDYLYYLRQEMPRRIAMEITHAPGVSFRELVGVLPITASTLSFHLKKLLGAGIVIATAAGREKTYHVEDAARVRRLVVTYRQTFVDNVVDRFADAWLNLAPE